MALEYTDNSNTIIMKSMHAAECDQDVKTSYIIHVMARIIAMYILV